MAALELDVLRSSDAHTALKLCCELLHGRMPASLGLAEFLKVLRSGSTLVKLQHATMHLAFPCQDIQGKVCQYAQWSCCIYI